MTDIIVLNRILNDGCQSTFLLNITKHLKNCNSIVINKELDKIHGRKKSLRSITKNDFYIEKQYYHDVFRYTKIIRLSKLFKYLCSSKNIHRCHDYISIKCMKTGYFKALELITDIRKIYFKFTKIVDTNNDLLPEKKTISNALNTIQRFINTYQHQKYFIILVLQKKNIPDDVIRFCYDFIC